MADDRPVEDPVEQLGRLQRDFDDFKSTMMSRVSRRPTGDIEATIRATPKAGSLFMLGQTLLRVDYPVLWQWAQDQGLVTGGLFTAGNGTTSFTLPNFAGRVPIAAGTLGSDVYTLGQTLGAAWRTLTISQMPAHNHGSAGQHGHHNAGIYNANNGAGAVFSVAANGDYETGSHTHSTQGSGDPFDNRQPSVAINWMIWT